MVKDKLSKISPVDKDEDFEEGNHDGDIYDDEEREEEVIDDEITENEEGFIEGYEHGEHEIKCAECNVVLVDRDIIEEEINGEKYNFCSEECASAFEVGKKRKQTRQHKNFKS